MAQSTTTERIEKELLDVFLRYIIRLPLAIPSRPNIKRSISGIEKIVHESFEASAARDSDAGNLAVHEFAAERKTEEKDEISLVVSYFSGKKDELSIEISGKNPLKYSIETENENPWSIPYGAVVRYERKNGIEKVSISYYEQADNYLAKHIIEKEDMSNRVQLKWLNLLPKSEMGGILGFTYIGDHSMGRRDDLTGGMARMVDIHESIHTPDEYETVCLTRWILEPIDLKRRYIK